jgi:nitrate/nitrite-specific signal transduction histidine kinase
MKSFRWRGLGSKIIAWLFVPTAIILTAVALVTFIAYQQVTEELVITRDEQLTRLAANQLSTQLEQFTETLTTLARTLGRYQEDINAQRDALKQSKDRLAVFDAGVVLLDTFGTVVAAEPQRPEIMGQDWSNRSYYQDIFHYYLLGTMTHTYSDIVFDGPHGGAVVTLTSPIIGEQEEFLGAVVGMFHAETTQAGVLPAEFTKLRLGSSAEAVLLDSLGQVIYQSSNKQEVRDTFETPALLRMLQGYTSALRTRDAQGQDIVASISAVPDTTWRLIVLENWRTLTSTSRGYQTFLLLLLGLGIAVPALVVSLAVRRVLRPIYDLMHAAQRVAKGDFSQRIDAHTGDEIEELAGQFNLMASQLQESYANLEKRVADRTKELAALNAVAAAVSRSLDLQEVLTAALKSTLDATAIEAGGIYLLDEERKALSLSYSLGLDAKLIDEIEKLKVGEGFSGVVVQSGEPIIVSDISRDTRLTRTLVAKRGFRSLAAVPLVSGGVTMGSLFIISRSQREFAPSEIELLTSIGWQIGAAVGNARLFSQAEQRLRELGALYQADQEMHRHLELDELLQTLVALAVDILSADKGSILIWDEQKQHLVVRASLGFKRETDERIAFAPGDGLAGVVATTGEPAVVEDTETDPRVTDWIVKSEDVKSFMHVPIMVGGEIFGVFNVDYSRPRAIGTEEQRLFIALAQRAALAIQNAQLYRQAQQAAVYEERQRLARDLHDAVTQTLFSASLIAEVLPRLWQMHPEEALHRLEEFRLLTRGALAEMRTLLVELRPSTLADAELPDLLRQLSESIIGRARLEVELTIEGRSALPDDVKVALYRIAQEALNNVVKHSRASRAWITLDSRPRQVTLTIRDDGGGFDPKDARPEHLGLGIMRERAQGINAELSIKSTRTKGTEIKAVWRNPGAQTA